jgi:hypothetical protein
VAGEWRGPWGAAAGGRADWARRQGVLVGALQRRVGGGRVGRGWRAAGGLDLG